MGVRKKGGRRQQAERGRSGTAAADLFVGGPHAVEAVLGGAPSVKAVRSVFLEDGAGHRAAEIADRARAGGFAVSRTGPGECDRLCGARSQGIAAEIVYAYADFSQAVEQAARQTADQEAAPDAVQSLLLFLDGISDPHNLGAIIRTAEAAGAGAVVVTRRRSAQITAVVARVSAGAALRVPVCRVANLVQALDEARRSGFWLVGLDADPDHAELASSYPGPALGLVLGGEGGGLGRLVASRCDELVRLPMAGRAESLNASVAAALAMYRVREKALFRGFSC
ncbi:MAG: 23S rRNA (guanosine(2251)-2'-O)-methyltransferase RlmB [Deltaproteobacteria bacterium]